MSIKQKFYEDYFKRSRLPEYRKTLQVAKEHGYRMVGVLDFARMIRTDKIEGKKIYLNRHDIDTSPKVASEMFEIEKEIYGKDGTATYYFRDTTTNIKLIREISAYGYEIGYHYEELATYIKKYKLRTQKEIRASIPQIGNIFLTDLERFRQTTGTKSETIASHGDFINTKKNIQSYEILKIPDVRDKANIVAEAYDQDIMKYVQKRFADQSLLANYSIKVIEAFEMEVPIVMTLTHPRNWKVDIWENTKENCRRVVQAIKYKI